MTTLARAVTAAISDAAGYHQFGRLQDSFRFIVNRDRVIIYSIYYWTRFVNDGRDAISLQKPAQMIFFRDPRDDPRISADYPTKRAKRRKLTNQEFREAREKGQLIVTQAVREAPGKHFIEKGIRTARTLVPQKVLEFIRDDVRRNIRRGRDKITVRL